MLRLRVGKLERKVIRLRSRILELEQEQEEGEESEEAEEEEEEPKQSDLKEHQQSNRQTNTRDKTT